MSASAERAVLVGALVAALSAAVAHAQYPGGGQRRSQGMQPMQERAQQPGTPTRQSPLTDPVLALEHELPSLRTDLYLTAEQQPRWGPFERAVRDAAELTRQRTKKLMAPRPVDAPPPNALGFVSALADDERLRADAMADAASRLRDLYEVLTPQQRSLFDRRVLLSQSEPLGTR